MVVRTFLFLVCYVCTVVHSSHNCNVRDFGAKGDNRTEDTHAIQQALTQCGGSNGGTVIFPTGKYLSRTLTVPTGSKNVNIVITQDAYLILWRDIPTWTNSSGFLMGTNTQNITITGPGQIDGGGEQWWPHAHSLHRPVLLFFVGINGMTVKNLRMKNGPSFHMHFVNGPHLYVNNITIESGCGYQLAPNTDGIHLDNIQHGYVGNSWIRNGDDCIPMGGNTRDVIVENIYCECSQNAGTGIIWANSGTLQDIIFRNITAYNTLHAAGLKSKSQYTGLITNVTFEDIHFDHVRGPAVYINVFKQDIEDNVTDPAIMQCTDITYKNIRGTNTADPGKFMCDSSKPCTGLKMTNLHVTGTTEGFRCSAAYGAYSDASPAPSCWGKK